jgi:ribosomal-protein-alanine N-acetyltransferase
MHGIIDAAASMRIALRTRIRPMTYDDVAHVVEIERESFPSMWPQTAYRRELQNKIARYIVVTETAGDEAEEPPGILAAVRRIVSGERDASGEHLLGFIGMWLMAGDAHIVTVAVREAYRRMGIGERLLIACMEVAMEADQEAVTLEVRKSNDVAQQLYAKYGFQRVGLRVRYYTDNNEDAVVMTTPDLRAMSYRAFFNDLRRQHRERYPDLWQ